MLVSRHVAVLTDYWQALLWLHSKPALWRQHLSQIDPNLRADFCWGNLPAGLWTNAKIQHLFSMLHIAAPLFIGVFSSIWCLLIFDAQYAVRAFVYTSTLVFVISVLMATLVSAAFALLGSSIAGILLGIFYGLENREWYIAVLAISSFALSSAGQSLIILSTWVEKPRPIARNILKISVLIQLSFFSIIIALSLWLPTPTYHIVAPGLKTLFNGLTDTIIYSTIYTFYVSLMMIIVLGFNLKRWGLASIIGIIFFFLVSILLAISFSSPDQEWTFSNLILRPLAGSMSNALFFALLFSIPYLIMRSILRNIYIGIWAGLFSSIGFYTFVFLQKQDYDSFLLLSVFIGILAGIIFIRRSPVLGILLFKAIHWVLSKNTAEIKIEQKNMKKYNWLQSFINGLNHLFEDYKKLKQESNKNISDILEADTKIPNNYTTSPIMDDRNDQVFVGREKTIERIQTYLEKDQNIPILLWGQRRIGKTSLAHQLKARLPQKFIPFYVDMQTIVAQARTESDFFAVLARKLYNCEPNTLEYPKRQDFFDNPWIVFDEFLDKLEQSYPERRIQLIFDEFESLEKAFADDVLEQDRFLSYLRDLLQHRSQISVLLIGFHFVSELPSWAEYFTSVLDINISYLNDTDVQHLIQPTNFDFPLHYESDAYQYLCYVTHNHPMMLQILCWQLVNRVNERQHINAKINRALICKQDIDAVIDQGKYLHAFVNMFNVSPQQEAFLIPLAKQGSGYHIPEKEVIEQISNDLLQKLYREGTLEKDISDNVGFTLEPIRRVFAAKNLANSLSH